MTPLHSFPEYTAAVRTIESYYTREALGSKLSESDVKEYEELIKRVRAYAEKPTPPNIINHDKNVMK